MAHCFVTRRLPGNALERLAGAHQVEVWPGADPPSRDQLIAAAADADALLTLLTDRVDAALLDACPRVRAVANYAVGFDNVDVAEATRRGIPVGHTPDVLTAATADLTMGLLLAIARRIPEGAEQVRDGGWGTWRPDWLLGADLDGARIGIVGRGRIGEAVARRAAGFGLEVAFFARGEQPLAEFAAGVDFLTLHCPLTDATRRLVDARVLDAMRPTAYLVNTARGGLVDQDALVDALAAGAIAGAALDVTDPEPLAPAHPLCHAPNALVTPHIGSAARGARAAMADRAVDNLLAALAGEPMPYCVNPEVRGA
jgi:glyoxylate reductase